MPSHALIHGGKEFEVDQVVAVGQVNGEPEAVGSGSEAFQKALRQPGEYLVGRTGIEPVFVEIIFPRHAERCGAQGIRHGAWIDKPLVQIHSGHDVRVPGGPGNQTQSQQCGASDEHKALWLRLGFFKKSAEGG